MTQIPSAINGASTASNKSSTDPTTADANSAVSSLNVDSFLKLMITELQHQDPLNPMDSSQMLDQISQMRQITSSDKLTSTLNSVLLGQNIASSTNLIGANVIGVSDDNQKVSGIVSSVSIDNGAPKLHLNLNTIAADINQQGELNKGSYSYRITWQNDDGTTTGLEFTGDQAIPTSADGQSIQFDNLPVSAGPKSIYRTDSSGKGEYRLVGTLESGTQSSFVDATADDNRSQTVQNTPFSRVSNAPRSFVVSLNNVGEVKPSGTPSG
jgi:flagellar basal-body rod modification protein FlgD